MADELPEQFNLPGDSPETKEWLAQTIAEVPEENLKQLETNEDIKKLIEMGNSAPDFLIKTVEFGSVKFRVRGVLSKKFRSMCLRVDNMMQAAGSSERRFNDADRTLYKTIAMVCIDEPYKDWQTWLVLDAKGAPVYNIYKAIVEALVRGDKSNKPVRKDG